MLNGMLPDSEKEDVLRHRASCARCEEFASDMESIDGTLRNLPTVGLRPEFREKLYQAAIRESSTFVSWRPYILRWLAIVVPVSLAFALGRFLPGFPWEVAQLVILLAACLTFVPALLKLKMRFRGYITPEEFEHTLVDERKRL